MITNGDKNLKTMDEHGAVLVEASIYFPLVLCTVVAMIYLGLINMQESVMLYQVDRIAMEIAREEAYIGYDAFGMNDGQGLDFAWSGTMPEQTVVETYFSSHHTQLSDLYRGIFFFSARHDDSEYESKYADAARAVTMIGIGTIGVPDVEIERNFFNSEVTVTIAHEIPLPGVLRYLGMEEDLKIECKRTKSIINPGEFVRNVDLAVDLTEYLIDKLDPGGNIKKFITKTQEIMQAIL